MAKRKSAPARIATGGGDVSSSDDENDAPPAGRRRSAPAALEQRALPRDRTETQLLAYDHGDALAKEYDRKSSAAVGSSSSSAVAGGSSGASSSLGAGIWEICSPSRSARSRARSARTSAAARAPASSSRVASHVAWAIRWCFNAAHARRPARATTQPAGGPARWRQGGEGGGVYAALRFVVRGRRLGASRRECGFNWAKSTAPQRVHLGWRGREDSRSTDDRV